MTVLSCRRQDRLRRYVGRVRPRRSSRLDPIHLVDLLVYLVVLNLATQLVPSIITESFTFSMLTALLLKLVLEVVVAIKKRVLAGLRSPGRPVVRAVNGLSLLVLLPGSKLVILELEHLLFGDRVSLGGFWPVTGLFVVLTLARRGVRALLASS